jgi:hypothetical protein
MGDQHLVSLSGVGIGLGPDPVTDRPEFFQFSF